jgi:hypothetical protein
MKKYFTYSILMIILTIIFAGSLNAIAAPTEEPTTGNTAAVKNTPTTEPTPFINEIGSIGDFNLKAAYEDNAPFEDNMAVNVRTIRENHEMDLIIHAVRTVERDHDIFSMFHIVLQKNGRDIELTKRMNIRIEQSGNFADYDNISVFQIDAAGSAQKLESKTENGYICFTTDTFGAFVLTGIQTLGVPETPSQTPASTTPTLQNGGNTGIIPSSQTAGGYNNENNDGVVTPGAFVFWLILMLVVGIWIGIAIGYIMWGRYKMKKNATGPKVIGE